MKLRVFVYNKDNSLKNLCKGSINVDRLFYVGNYVRLIYLYTHFIRNSIELGLES